MINHGELAKGGRGPVRPRLGRVRLVELLEDQCDPDKCTGRKLIRRGLAAGVRRHADLPRGGVVLDPRSQVAFSPADSGAAHRRGVVALDCSWKRVEATYRKYDFDAVGPRRALPYMLAANPVHFGQAMELSTLEAFAAALFIVGEPGQAQELLGSYTWGDQFLFLNRLPLEAYAASKTSTEVVRAQAEFAPPARDKA